jgi:hypothetical protein
MKPDIDYVVPGTAILVSGLRLRHESIKLGEEVLRPQQGDTHQSYRGPLVTVDPAFPTAWPGGSCPAGYTSSGSFCVPGQSAQDAIAKPANGSRLRGWTSSGSFCLRIRSGGRVTRCHRTDQPLWY